MWPQDDADYHLQRLFPEHIEAPWYKTFGASVKELIRPTKLPPLEVTSKPVPVNELWGLTAGHEKQAGLSSLLIHGGVIALLFLVGTNPTVQQMVKEHVTLIAPDIAPYQPKMAVKKERWAAVAVEATVLRHLRARARFPRSNRAVHTPFGCDQQPEPETSDGADHHRSSGCAASQVSMNQYGDPLAKIGLPSNGPGQEAASVTAVAVAWVREGAVDTVRVPAAASGRCVSHRRGRVGPAARVQGGAGVFGRSPEAKYQGTVVLYVVVDEKGNPRDLKVVRALASVWIRRRSKRYRSGGLSPA